MPFTFCVQLADFVHHAMYAEVAELTAYLSFEYIYQHDVYHCLNQCVRSFASHMRQLVHPSRVVVVLHDAELQQEKVGECKVSSLRIVNKRLHQVEQVPYSLLVHFVAVG